MPNIPNFPNFPDLPRFPNLSGTIANNVVNNIPSAAMDVIGVFNQDFQQVITRARAMKAVVKPEAKTMDHPVETGGTITDFRIILPIEIELSVVLQAADYKNTYSEITQLFLSAPILNVQTKAGVFKNQVITGIPHEEDPDQFDILIVAIRLRETQFTSAQFSTISPQDPTNSSTVNRGNIQTAAASPQDTQKSSLLYRLFN